MSRRAERAAAAALLALGLAQMAGDVLGSRALRGLAAATAASPAPRVFSAVQGLETYSTRFYVEWQEGRARVRVPIDSERYARLRGPYNRRNTYGAVVAFGPVLRADPATRPLLDAVARHALCGEAPLLRELGIGATGPVWIRLEPRPGTDLGDLPSVLEPPCGS